MTSRNAKFFNGKLSTHSPNVVATAPKPRKESKRFRNAKRPRHKLPVTLVSSATAALIGVSILPTVWPSYQTVSTDLKRTVSRQPIRTLEGHSSWVYAIALSPDGKTLVSGSYDGQIKIWDLPSGALRQTLQAHVDAIEALVISPDGRFLVSGSWDNRVKVWDLKTLNVLYTFAGHRDDVKAIAISADGKWLASGGADRTVHVWRVDTGQERFTWRHPAWVKTLAFSPDSDQVVIGGYDGGITVQSLHSNPVPQTWTGHRQAIWAVAFSPDGQTLASGGADGAIKLWRMVGGGMQKSFAAHHETVSSLAWSPDGRYLVSSSTDRSIKVWNVHTGEIVNRWIGHRKPIWSLAVSPDSWMIASGSSDQTIKLWSPFGASFDAGGATQYDPAVF